MLPMAYSLHWFLGLTTGLLVPSSGFVRSRHLRLITAVWALPALVSLTLAGCGGSDVAVNSPATANDTGGSSGGGTGSTTPVTATASLSWLAPIENTDGSKLTNLGGYTIYYGTESSALTQTI